jgi:hypothetical protein
MLLGFSSRPNDIPPKLVFADPLSTVCCMSKIWSFPVDDPNAKDPVHDDEEDDDDEEKVGWEVEKA